MTIQEALQNGAERLRKVPVDTPLLDATVLLAEALRVTKESLYASLSQVVGRDGSLRYGEFLEQRCLGRPVSYIRKRKEFYGLSFSVDERVFIPRPATESLVEAVLKFLGTKARIHDICTGSGCIAISLKAVVPSLAVSASDISRDAGVLFEHNCRYLLGEVLPFYISDILTDVPGSFDIITANPPYLTNLAMSEMKCRAWPEPEAALRGGEDGLSWLMKIIDQARGKLNPGGRLFMEADPEQMIPLLGRLYEGGFSEVRVDKDLAGCDRVISGRVS